MQRTSFNLLIWLATLGFLSLFVLEQMRRYAGISRVEIPFVLGPGLVCAGLVLLGAGWQVKRLREGEVTWINPPAAGQVAIIALATSRGASVFVGLFLGEVAFCVLDGLFTSWLVRQLIAALITAVSCAILIAVALLVESWCALKPDDDEWSAGKER